MAQILALVLSALRSPLVDAVKQGDVQAVRALLKQAPMLVAPEGDGATALHWAVYRDRRSSFGCLLAAGAEAHAANDLAITPLCISPAANGNATIVRLLLDKRADANAAAETGVTPLMEAARSGSVDAVRLLLAQRRADVNARERDRGQTALMWAVSRQHPDVVKVLLENHADVHARTATRPLMVMLDQGPRRAVKTSAQDARQIDAGGSTALLFAAQAGDVESARASARRRGQRQRHGRRRQFGAGDGDVLGEHRRREGAARRRCRPECGRAGYTALHAAALRGDLATVKALLARGASPHAMLTKGSPVRRFGSQWALLDAVHRRHAAGRRGRLSRSRHHARTARCRREG